MIVWITHVKVGHRQTPQLQHSRRRGLTVGSTSVQAKRASAAAAKVGHRQTPQTKTPRQKWWGVFRKVFHSDSRIQGYHISECLFH